MGWRLRLPRLTHEELLLVLTGSLSGIIFGSTTLALPLYLKSLGLDSFQVGLLVGGYVLVGSTTGLLVSALADAYGRKRFFIVGRLVSAAAYLLLFLGVPAAALLIFGLGGGSLQALMAEKSRDIDRNMSLMSSLSTAFAIVGASIPWAVGLRDTMLVDSLTVMATAALVAPVREGYRGTGRVTFRLGSIRNIARLSTDALIGLGAGLILPLMSLWFNLRFHATAARLSPVYMMADATLALASIGAPALAKAMGRVRAIVLTHAIGIALLIALPFSSSLYEAAAIFVVRNAAMNMANPLFMSLVVTMIPEEERARGSSLINLIGGLPRSMGPWLTGYMYSVGNLTLPFFITAALYSAATAAFYVLFRNVR
ncbi:MFS transporter [Acidilobus sp.]|uniref:MFS transporter n=1 Tax=Acidilobus sp. TaxID=1872109 RepID=UPI003D05BE1E